MKSCDGGALLKDFQAGEHPLLGRGDAPALEKGLRAYERVAKMAAPLVAPTTGLAHSRIA